VTPKRPNQPAGTPPDLSKEKAYSVLKEQLEKLQAFKGLNYQAGVALGWLRGLDLNQPSAVIESDFK